MSGPAPALFAMNPEYLPRLFPEAHLRRLGVAVDIDPGLTARSFADPEIAPLLSEIEVIISGWGAPSIDAAVLDKAPNLRAILHAAGSVKWIDAAVYQRGIVVSSAVSANAIPVAEYTLAAILMSGKDIFGLREQFRTERSFSLGKDHPDTGNFERTVGLIGASRIGRRVIELLRPFEFEVLLADPYVDAAEADRLGVRLVEVDKLVAEADIVSVHAPDLEETRHLINADRLASMRDGAVFINTARGGLVDADALLDELCTARLSAVIDVTTPEPLPPESPLYDLPNVFLTPHVAGSQGNELARMGLYIVEEAERLVAGEPLLHSVDPGTLWRQA